MNAGKVIKLKCGTATKIANTRTKTSKLQFVSRDNFLLLQLLFFVNFLSVTWWTPLKFGSISLGIIAWESLHNHWHFPANQNYCILKNAFIQQVGNLFIMSLDLRPRMVLPFAVQIFPRTTSLTSRKSTTFERKKVWITARGNYCCAVRRGKITLVYHVVVG